MPTTAEQKAQGWLSVTEVLDAFIPKGLLDWYLRTGKAEAKKISTIAMKIGTRVDELIQDDVLKGSYKLSAKDPIEVKNCMDAWVKFKSDYSPNIKAVQIEVKDDIHKLIGHIDLIMDNMVVDIKCASSIKANYWLQVAKYSQMYGADFKEVAIIRLDKNLGTYEFVKCSRLHRLVEVYDGLLSAYRYYNAPKEQGE